MNRVVEVAGVDVDQWKTLTRTFVRVDFAQLLGAFGRSQAGRARIALFTVSLFYVLTGVAIGEVALSSSDALLGGTIMATYVAVVVGSGTLATHASTIVSPDDHAILGYRPITSRTYLAVRVTTILVHTMMTAVLIGSAAVVEFTIARGPAVGLTLAATILTSAVATTLGIVAIYAWLVQAAGPSGLSRIVSYAQLVSSSVLYLGLAIVSGATLGRVLTGVRLPRTVWVLLYPGTWFGSYVAIGSGQVDSIVIVSAGCSAISVAALLAALGGKLSFTYSERLAAIATASSTSRVSRRSSSWRWPWFGRGESRAIALLVRTQFKYDNRFRLGVLTFIPLTVYYLYASTRRGTIPDPFVAGSISSGATMFVQVVLYFLPASLKQLVNSSDAYRASWIFHATPADRTRLVIAARNAITVLVVLPYLVLLTVYFIWSFGNVGHAILHAVFLGLMSQIVFQIIVLADPRLPFSDPPNRTRGTGGLFGLMTVMMFAGIGLYWFVTALIYPSALYTTLTLGLFIVTVPALDWLTRQRIRTAVEDLTYLA